MRLRLPGARLLAERRRRLVQRWLDRRVPPESPRIVLHRRRLFILPTWLGYTFALTLALLLLGSLNYGTSLGFIVTFLLAGAGAMGMLHTYRNLEGVALAFGPAPAVFAGDTAWFPVHVDSSDRPRWALRLTAPDGSDSDFNALCETPVATSMAVPADRRGRLRPGRSRLSTEWPLGLFSVWSWLHPRVETVAYPLARDHGFPLPPTGGPGQRGRAVAGDEDFAGLRDYRPGDPPRRIAWKALARTGELQTKAFEDVPAGERWLAWDALGSLGGEERLQQLCHWVVELDARGQRYGLALPDRRIGPDTGGAHRHRCLEALALFGLPPAEQP